MCKLCHTQLRMQHISSRLLKVCKHSCIMSRFIEGLNVSGAAVVVNND